jgi:hypothetical protein
VAITEEERHRLYQRLEEVLGREQAATLMEHLPPVGWADVATKRDLGHLEQLLRSDIEQLRTETQQLRGEMAQGDQLLRGEIGQLRGDLGHLDQSLRGEIGQLRGEIGHLDQSLRREIGRMADQLRSAWRHDLLLQTFALIGANVALVGAAVAVLRPG